MKYDNILQTIGRTPVVRINKLAPTGVNLFVKLESFNPMSSVKDRMALAVIWHYWIGLVLFFSAIGTVLAVVIGYFVKVQSLKYPPKR